MGLIPAGFHPAADEECGVGIGNIGSGGSAGLEQLLAGFGGALGPCRAVTGRNAEETCCADVGICP
jgi:hypothetical protein